MLPQFSYFEQSHQGPSGLQGFVLKRGVNLFPITAAIPLGMSRQTTIRAIP